MGNRWTVGQVLELAPDAASVKAARGLASGRTWSELGSTESLVWGRCQGRAKSPYQVTVDLGAPAFRCSCPSRKQPCKHGLALLLMWAEGGGSVADATQVPAFAGEWAARASRAPDRPRTTGARPVDPEAQARRTAERVATMSSGLDDFERWLLDLVRQGLAAARRQPYAHWDGVAARLVDAQLPALAERVRATAGTIHARPDWAEHLLAELGRWYLAVRAWRRRDELDEDLVADLRVVLGWSRRAEEVAAAGQRHTDRWVVAGRRLGGDQRVRSQRTWLVGERSGEVVLLLDFAASGAALPVAQVVGTVVEGEVATYPGAAPRRALLAGEHRLVGSAAVLPGASSLDAALDGVARAIAANPWVDRVPVCLAGAVPVVGDDGSPCVADGSGRALPVVVDPDPWALLALTGGRATDLFGEWEDGRLHPTTVVVDGELVAL